MGAEVVTVMVSLAEPAALVVRFMAVMEKVPVAPGTLTV